MTTPATTPRTSWDFITSPLTPVFWDALVSGRSWRYRQEGRRRRRRHYSLLDTVGRPPRCSQDLKLRWSLFTSLFIYHFTCLCSVLTLLRILALIVFCYSSISAIDNAGNFTSDGGIIVLLFLFNASIQVDFSPQVRSLSQCPQNDLAPPRGGENRVQFSQPPLMPCKCVSLSVSANYHQSCSSE